VAGPPVVAILNTNDDVVEMLRIVVEEAGYVAVSMHVDAIRRGEQSLADFIAEHDPQVIIYDLPPPYERNWRHFEHIRESKSIRGRKFVVTSTNARQVRAFAGDAVPVYEIVGKPYDINEIVKAVSRALGHDELPEGARRA
jgi:DNA-binding NarL/FixJ family response regulator